MKWRCYQEHVSWCFGDSRSILATFFVLLSRTNTMSRRLTIGYAAVVIVLFGGSVAQQKVESGQDSVQGMIEKVRRLFLGTTFLGICSISNGRPCHCGHTQSRLLMWIATFRIDGTSPCSRFVAQAEGKGQVGLRSRYDHRELIPLERYSSD